MPIGSRYVVGPLLGRGGMGSVYRARDRLSGQELALKCITLPSEQSTAQSATAFAATFAATSAAAAGAIDSGDSGRDTVAQGTDRTVLDADGEARVEVQPSGDQQALRLALAQEFRTLASLRHPHIISVLDYGFDANRAPFFTMELLAGAMPLLEAAVSLPLQAQIALLVQVAQALSYLHRHGVIHRDLKPGNVLVVQTADGPCAKVLDFGLAMAKPRAQQGTREIAGTLAYMAPESVLGEPLTEATDLYALGMMAFELIAGRHPFDLASAGELVLAILDRTPEVDSLAVPEALRDTLRRLLHKRPRERPRDGAQVAQELASAVGLPRAAEPAALRESYLQAARFIGRTDETATLLAALERAVAPGGKGAAFLVGGESGVGKSRLLDEVRTQALVRGALVLRGQASQHAGAAFQVFRDVLRPLCLYVELSELEASVLLALIPDLPQLLSRPVASPPELEPRAMQERVFLVVNSVLARIHKPLLILLEDLQWAGAESVALLSLLVQRAQTRPHLWIGSYRDDEAADLPMRLPDPQVLRLHRLARTEVAALSASMLGQESVRPDIVELLHRETEGNEEIKYDDSHETSYISCG